MKTRAPFLGRARRADRSLHEPLDGSHDDRPDGADLDVADAPSLVRRLLARALAAGAPGSLRDDDDFDDVDDADREGELDEELAAVGDAGDDGAEARDGIGAATLVALGFAGGLAIGAFAWSRLLESSARQLFSRSRARRYWAVSYLGARPSVDTARLLRDYVRWEPHPLLRRRARRVLAAVEAALGR